MKKQNKCRKRKRLVVVTAEKIHRAFRELALEGCKNELRCGSYSAMIHSHD